jgi:hypothetical protein
LGVRPRRGPVRKKVLVLSNAVAGSSCVAPARPRTGRRGREVRCESRDANLAGLHRDGGRHPGPRDSGALRGASQERWPRSVRAYGAGSPCFVRRAGDNGCPLAAEEGNLVSRKRACSFTRSRDLCLDVVARSRKHASHAGASVGLGQTRSRGRNRGRCVCRRTARHAHGIAPRRKARGMQGKRVAALVLVRTRELEAHARTSCFVAEVVRRRLVSSSPRYRPPKRGVGAGERGPSKTRERVWFQHRVLSGASRRDDRDPVRVASTAHAGRLKAQGGARASSGDS